MSACQYCYGIGFCRLCDDRERDQDTPKPDVAGDDSGEQKIQCWEFSGSGIVSGPYTKGEFVRYEDHAKEVERLKNALKYIRNEMKYRLYQIEQGLKNDDWGHITMYGEMIRAIEMADQALADCGKK